MPVTNNYHLTIDLNGFDEKKPIAGNGEQQTQKLSPVEKKIKSLVSYSAITGTAIKALNNEVSLISEKTGAIQYEQRIQEGISIGTSLLSSIGVGLATGNIALGFLTFGIQTANWIWDVSQKERQRTINETIEDVGQRLQARRIGVSNSRF